MVTKHTRSVARILPAQPAQAPRTLPARLLRVGLQVGDHAGNPHDDATTSASKFADVADLSYVLWYLLGLATIDHQMRHVES
jgi:hypothetical protein